MFPFSDIFYVCPSLDSTENVNHGCPGSIVGQLLWSLWWTWGGFFGVFRHPLRIRIPPYYSTFIKHFSQGDM
jgi:hypothetical protein